MSPSHRVDQQTGGIVNRRAGLYARTPQWLKRSGEFVS
jgi:hypothetical protein